MTNEVRPWMNKNTGKPETVRVRPNFNEFTVDPRIPVYLPIRMAETVVEILFASQQNESEPNERILALAHQLQNAIDGPPED